MDLFKLEPGLAIWTWITFAILFFILAKFVIPAILKNLQEREDYISSSVDKTAKVEARLKEIEEERAEILEKAGKEADDLLLETRKQADELKRTLTGQAQAEAQEILAQARDQAGRERQAVMEQLQDDLADFVCDASEKVAGFSFVGDREKELTRELVKEL
nr:F0F1 ATP synthase subunit B [uncultured Sphaerochaeta sp.]